MLQTEPLFGTITNLTEGRNYFSNIFPNLNLNTLKIMIKIIKINISDNDVISKIGLSSLYLLDLTFEKFHNLEQFFNRNQNIDSVVETPFHMPFGYNLISSGGLTRGGD